MLVSIIGRNHRIKNEESGQRHFIKTETYIKNNFNLLLKGRQLSRLLLNNLVADRISTSLNPTNIGWKWDELESDSRTRNSTTSKTCGSLELRS